MHGQGRAQGGKGTFIENRRDRKKAAVNLKRGHLPVGGRLGGGCIRLLQTLPVPR